MKQKSRALWMAKSKHSSRVLDIIFYWTSSFLPGMHLKPTHPSCVKLNLFILYTLYSFFLGKKNIIDFSVTKSLKEFSILFTPIKSQTRVFLFLKCACPLFIHFGDYCINLSHPTAHLNHHSNSLDTPDSATQKSIFSSWSST